MRRCLLRRGRCVRPSHSLAWRATTLPRYAAMPGGIPQFAYGTSQSSAGSHDPDRTGMTASVDAMSANMEKTGNPGAQEPADEAGMSAPGGARTVAARAVPPLEHKASFRAHRASRNSIVGVYPNGTWPHEQAGPGTSTAALAAAAVAATTGSFAGASSPTSDRGARSSPPAPAAMPTSAPASAPTRGSSFADFGVHAYPPTSLQSRAARTGLASSAATQPNDADDADYPPMPRVAAGTFVPAASQGFAARPDAGVGGGGGGDLLSSDSGEYAAMPSQFTSHAGPTSGAPAVSVAPAPQQHTSASWGIASAPMPAPVASTGMSHGFARATSGPGFLAAAAPAHSFVGMAGAAPQFMPRAMTQPVPSVHNGGMGSGVTTSANGQPDVATLQAEIQALRMQLQVCGACSSRGMGV